MPRTMKNRTLFLAGLAFVMSVSSFFGQTGETPAAKQPNNFKHWLSAILGIDIRFYTSASSSRSEIPVPLGDDLVVYNLKKSEEKVVWHATGLLSPANVGTAQVAILRRVDPATKPEEAGLWLVDIAKGSQRRVISDNSLLAIFGHVKTAKEDNGNPHNHFLVLKLGKNNQKVFVEVNLDTGGAEECQDV